MKNRFKKNEYKKWLRFFIIILFITILYNVISKINDENKILEKEVIEVGETTEKEIEENTITTKNIENQEKIVEEEYEGYKVAAFLEIPTINLKTNILEEYSTSGLAKCASKFWGTNANEVGNFCIAGHNYKKPNMFTNVYKLKSGDILYLTDNKNGRVKYVVYDIYKVKPENTNSLSQKTNGKREITLITCTANAKQRIIVKAKEI